MVSWVLLGVFLYLTQALVSSSVNWENVSNTS